MVVPIFYKRLAPRLFSDFLLRLQVPFGMLQFSRPINFLGGEISCQQFINGIVNASFLFFKYGTNWKAKEVLFALSESRFYELS